MPGMPDLHADPAVLCLLSTVLIPILSRSDAETVAVGTGKMRAGGQAAGQPDLDDRLAGLLQHLPRPIQAQLQIILRRHAVQILFEYPFQLPPRDSDVPGDLV